MKRCVYSYCYLCCLALAISGECQAQIGGAAASPAGSLRENSSLGAFRSRAVNPNFNPPGSLSTIQRLNPPGSLNAALNLNPQGSVDRPRSTAEPRPSYDDQGVYSQRRANRPGPVLDPGVTYKPAYSAESPSLQSSLRLLGSELIRYENGEAWIKALKLRELERVLKGSGSERLTKDDYETVSTAVDRYRRLKSDRRYDAVTRLPGFAALDEGLTNLVSARPIGGGPPEGMPGNQ